MATYNHVLSSTEFRKKGVRLIAELNANWDRFSDDEHRLVITKRGRTVAIVDPVAPHSPGWLGHMVSYLGDVVTPLDVTWDAMRESGPVWGKGVGWTMDDNEPGLLLAEECGCPR